MFCAIGAAPASAAKGPEKPVVYKGTVFSFTHPKAWKVDAQFAPSVHLLFKRHQKTLIDMMVAFSNVAQTSEKQLKDALVASLMDSDQVTVDKKTSELGQVKGHGLMLSAQMHAPELEGPVQLVSFSSEQIVKVNGDTKALVVMGYYSTAASGDTALTKDERTELDEFFKSLKLL